MNLKLLVSQSEKFIEDNSPSILAGMGVVGALATAYLTGKASFQAADDIWADLRDREFYGKEPAEKNEKFKLVWKNYIPAATTGVFTVGCIIGATAIGNRRTAAVAAAYSISEKAYTEYRERVVEKFGQKKDQEVKDEIARDRVKGTPSSEVVIIGDGNVLCYDQFSGRYFQSSMEDIKSAMNWVNYEARHSGYCSLGDFYQRLGLRATSYSEEVGWLPDHFVEVTFSTVLDDQMRPCLALDFTVMPIRHYHKFGG